MLGISKTGGLIVGPPVFHLHMKIKIEISNFKLLQK